MKTSHCVAGLSLAGLSFATPIARRQSSNIDNTILQFALTLEHLENVFYKGAISNFTAQDFANAGYGADYYNDLKYIAYDEQVHVQALTAALQANGQTPVAACQYNFPYTDVASFITLSSILEGVGTSAYLGGAPLITSKQYLTIAGSILATEALHTSLQRAAIGEVPMANPFETPLSPNPVFTLAAAFIVSCPASNPALPFKAFPSLMATGGSCIAEEPQKKRSLKAWSSSSSPSATYTSAAASTTSSAPASHTSSPSSGCALPAKQACAAAIGSVYTFTAASAVPFGSYVTFASGLAVISVQGSINDKTVSAAIPAGVSGQTYVFITNKSENATVADADILFGPAILEVAPPAPVLDYSVL